MYIFLEYYLFSTKDLNSTMTTKAVAIIGAGPHALALASALLSYDM